MYQVKKPPAFNGSQITTLIVIGCVVASVLFLKYDIGIVAFVGGAVLVALKVVTPKRAIDSISWDTLILVGGVAMMVNVMSVAGEITLLADGLASIMTATTAPSVMVVMGGTVQTSALIAGIVAGSNAVIYSPLSTLGAMTLAALPEVVNKEKYFNKMIVIAVLSVLFCAVLGIVGLYR